MLMKASVGSVRLLGAENKLYDSPLNLNELSILLTHQMQLPMHVTEEHEQLLSFQPSYFSFEHTPQLLIVVYNYPSDLNKAGAVYPVQLVGEKQMRDLAWDLRAMLAQDNRRVRYSLDLELTGEWAEQFDSEFQVAASTSFKEQVMQAKDAVKRAEEGEYLFVEVALDTDEHVRVVDELIEETRREFVRKNPKGKASVVYLSEKAFMAELQKRNEVAAADSNVTLYSSRDPRYFCFVDEDTCKTRTGTCLGRGSCVLIDQCFHCKCNAGFTGVACQYYDYIDTFHILFWTTIVLIVFVAAIIVGTMQISSEIGKGFK